MKVKQMVHDKLGNNYDVILPEIKHPRLRITNINVELSNDDLIEELKKHNPNIENLDMKLITTIPRKFRSHIYKVAVVELKSDEYEKLIQIETLMLPWRECKVIEHVYIKRCFKCCGFSHISKDCKAKHQVCSKCGGAHKFTDCKSQKLCCLNCKEANDKFKTNLDTKHHAWSKECIVLQRRIKTLKSKIEYKHAE